MKTWIKVTIIIVSLLIVAAGILITLSVITTNKNRTIAIIQREQDMLDANIQLQLQREADLALARIEQDELAADMVTAGQEAIIDQKATDEENARLLAEGIERTKTHTNAVIPPVGTKINDPVLSNTIKDVGRKIDEVNSVSGGYLSSRLGLIDLYVKDNHFSEVNGIQFIVREWNNDAIRLENNSESEGEIDEVIIDPNIDVVWIRYYTGNFLRTEKLPEKVWSCVKDGFGLNTCLPTNCESSYRQLCE